MARSLLVPPRPLAGPIALGSTIILWAAAFPAIKVALRSFEPISLASVRFALAAIAFGAVLAWKRPRLAKTGDIAIAAAGGAIGIAAYNILLNAGQVFISAGAASFIVGVQPLFATALAALFLKERVIGRQWIGLAVSVIGLGIISIANGDAEGSSIGVILVILAAVCSGGFFVLQRPLIRRLGLFVSTQLIVVSGAFCLAPWLGAGLGQVRGATAESLGALLYLAFGAGFLGYLTWARALNVYGAGRASAYLFLMAPVAAAMDIVFLQTFPTPAMFAGCAVIFVGVAIGAIRHRPLPSAAESFRRRPNLWREGDP